MIRRAGAMLFAAVFAACAVPPADPFERGMQASKRGNLLDALRAFESVPATHARHAEARIAATEVENRARRGHQALLDGLVLRAEGRDREALASLQRARDAWPGLPSVDTWIRATRDRWSATNVRIAAAPVRTVRPAVDCERDDSREAPVGEAPSGVVVSSVPEPLHGTATSPIAPVSDVRDPLATTEGAEDTVALGLVAVEARLGHGELELAVIDLLELARRHPTDARVQNRLVRVLHQRALLRYGQGALTTAIADWERVLSIQPDNRVVKALLDAVRAEAAAPL